MKKSGISTSVKRLLSDVYTPVGIYLRLRDRFRDTILLESTDHHVSENSFSFICINAIAGIEIIDNRKLEFKVPGQPPEKAEITDPLAVPALLSSFMDRFDPAVPEVKEGRFAQGLYGYTSYNAVQFFESVKFQAKKDSIFNDSPFPALRYRLYQYVIVVNHYKDELFICENKVNGVESDVALVESLIKSKDIPSYPFRSAEEESSNMSDDQFMEMVGKGIQG